MCVQEQIHTVNVTQCFITWLQIKKQNIYLNETAFSLKVIKTTMDYTALNKHN